MALDNQAPARAWVHHPWIWSLAAVLAFLLLHPAEAIPGAWVLFGNWVHTPRFVQAEHAIHNTLDVLDINHGFHPITLPLFFNRAQMWFWAAPRSSCGSASRQRVNTPLTRGGRCYEAGDPRLQQT